MRSTSFQDTGVGLMRTSPVRPIPGLLTTATALAVFIVLPIVLAAMCVYGWSTP